MSGHTAGVGTIPIILADANVLYSRVLRDYLLYAADQELISVTWSPEVLAEMTEHLQANTRSFTAESGKRLVKAMNSAFPYAQVDITDEARAKVAGLDLPDDDDRHVLAAAVAAEADVLCTSNIKDFPPHAVAHLGVSVRHPDALLSSLVRDQPHRMRTAHNTAVSRLPGATDVTTMAALRRAGAPTVADLMAQLLSM